MADDSIEVRITATTADLQAQLALAQASVRAMGSEVRSLAGEMAALGQSGAGAASAGLAATAQQAAQATAQVANLKAGFAAATPAAANLGNATAAAVRATEDQIRQLDRELQAGMQHLQALQAQGQISAGQRLQLEAALTNSIYGQELSLADKLQALYAEGTTAYQSAADRKVTIAQQQADAIRRLNDQAALDAKKQADQEAAAWRNAFREVESAEDTFIRGALSGRQSLNQSLRSATQQLVQSEIMADAKWLTNKLLVNAGVLASDKATTEGGLLAHLLGEEAKTSATLTGNAAREASNLAAAQAGFAAETASNKQSISQDAATAAANVYKSVSAIPYVGWLLAPLAAAAAFAAVEAFGSFEVGAVSIPQNQLANLHAGEMVVPASFADGVRSGALSIGGPGAAASGGNVAVAMNVAAVDAASFTTMANRYARQLAKVVVQQMNANPSLRPSY